MRVVAVDFDDLDHRVRRPTRDRDIALAMAIPSSVVWLYVTGWFWLAAGLSASPWLGEQPTTDDLAQADRSALQGLVVALVPPAPPGTSSG